MRKVKDASCPGCGVRIAPYLDKDNQGYIKCWRCGELLEPEYGEAPPQNAAWGEEPPTAATQGHRATGSGIQDTPQYSRSGELPPSEAQRQFAAMGGAVAMPAERPATIELAQQEQPPPSEQANPQASKERQGEFGPGTAEGERGNGEVAPPPSEFAGPPRKEAEAGPPDIVEPRQNPSDALPPPDTDMPPRKPGRPARGH